MAHGKHNLAVDVPIRNVWTFVSDMNNLAPLIPGYVEHEIHSSSRSVWIAKGEIGLIEKSVRMQLDITDVKEPGLIAFTLKGLNENFSGDGYFSAEKIHDQKTVITGCLRIKANGLAAPMMNSVLKKIVPKAAKRFTRTVAKGIVEREPAIIS
ncbi:CoxG family protein [Virgibacillus ihumii]|uniref:CoxG family protein n=1 Tax=Virgibacillus ihumii TaxID=2686091 RepID=UPI00157CAE6F|nr:SRPBCC family protein [Virgibacillus ihumii]